MQIKSLVFSGALGLATALMPVAASAQDAAGRAAGVDAKGGSSRIANRCKVVLGTANVSASTGSFSTSASTFSDIPETTVNFRIRGSANRCVLVVFSGQPFAQGSELIHVRALRDGSPGTPSSVQFGTNDATFNKVTTAQFQFQDVPPGRHVIQMQYRSRAAGQTVFITNPVTSVFNSD